MGIHMGACMPCYQGKVSCNLSWHTKLPQQESAATNPAPEPPKASSPSPSQGPTHPAKWAPSLGPGPSTPKKAKTSISKSRSKTPSVTQKAKFSIDALTPQSIPQASALKLIATPINPLLDPRPRPSSDSKDHIIKGLEVQVASLESQVKGIPDLELQVTPPACICLMPDAETSSGNGQITSPIQFPRIGGQGSTLITPQPSVGQPLC
ncbi:hypothetical protein PAXRUDRAFT_19048 [Paxillus rubicundulus Ve08.2h10]|uniref:Uncharacterized protein n=1 Tax=Paxillus rubicundulus Ve08.2h10 TaxID=930991 RepID=A0A0D0BVG2_9AGAM|nr:hypothetical protein PAXRUDRAFT_19048 [Paxillus rubicundulus Ve08.2h10]